MVGKVTDMQAEWVWGNLRGVMGCMPLGEVDKRG